MRKRILLLIVHCVLSTVLVAQCDCVPVFNALVDVTETNYAGYTDKVTSRTLGRYTHHKKQLIARTDKVDNEIDCYLVLLDYLAYFGDKHLQIDYLASANIPNQPADITNFFADAPRVDIEESAIRQKLDGSQNAAIEGIYTLDQQYRIAIMKRPSARSSYVGVVLDADGIYWTRGQIKMEIIDTDEPDEFRILFYMRDHSLRVHRGELTPEGDLSIAGLSNWQREYPLPDHRMTAKSGQDIKSHFNSPFDITFPDHQTTMLRLASFAEDAGQKIKKLIADEWEQITSRPNLVIDLRGNSGGTDYSYEPLLPLIYTDTIHTTGMAVLASPANIAAWSDLLSHPGIPNALKADLRIQIEEMYAHEGSFVDFPDDRTYFKQVLARPSRVAILVDGRCASATEQFLLAARQSDKVTLFGQTTAGALDYSNMRQADLGCARFQFYYATTRSRRVPDAAIDNIGIQPDHPLAPGTDWIAQVLAWLSQ